MSSDIQEDSATARFLEVVKTYFSKRGMPPEIDGDIVRCAATKDGRGYDVTLWYEPDQNRTYCRCVIRNVFPAYRRDAVIRFLKAWMESPGPEGGVLGVSAHHSDMMWTTFCETRDGKMDESLIHETLTTGVGTFDRKVVDVQEFVAKLQVGFWDSPRHEPLN